RAVLGSYRHDRQGFRTRICEGPWQRREADSGQRSTVASARPDQAPRIPQAVADSAGQKVTQLSESQTRSVAAIGNGCVIPGEREARGPGSKVGVIAQLGPGLRRGDEGSVIPGERSARGPGSKLGAISTLGPGLRRGDAYDRT